MIYTRKTISRQLLAKTTSSSSNLPEMKRYAWILGTCIPFQTRNVQTKNMRLIRLVRCVWRGQPDGANHTILQARHPYGRIF